MATSTEIDYNDERFKKVEEDKKAAIKENDKTYDNMINQSDNYYDSQIAASKEWEKKQLENQQAQTDFAIEKIEQQKEQTRKDYIKEQSGAYTDWQKQSNQYGANAEAMAAQGMTNTGYSESSQVSMYNTYQNRVATAREVFNRAVLNFDNSIQEARLQNNSALAKISYDAFQIQSQLALDKFQYKNGLILEKANKKTEIENNYYNRYQNVADQIWREKSLAEEIRQFNEQMAEERRQFNKMYGGSKKSSSSRSSGSSSRKSSSSTKKSSDAKIEKDDTNTISSEKSSGAPINAKSVLNLGYGPISGNTLKKKEASGQVKSTVINGQRYFRNTGITKKYTPKYPL